MEARFIDRSEHHAAGQARKQRLQGAEGRATLRGPAQGPGKRHQVRQTRRLFRRCCKAGQGSPAWPPAFASSLIWTCWHSCMRSQAGTFARHPDHPCRASRSKDGVGAARPRPHAPGLPWSSPSFVACTFFYAGPFPALPASARLTAHLQQLPPSWVPGACCPTSASPGRPCTLSTTSPSTPPSPTRS